MLRKAAFHAQKIEAAAALAGLVVEPGAFAQIDADRSVLAPSQLVRRREGLVRLAEDFSRDRPHKRSKLVGCMWNRGSPQPSMVG